MAEILGGTSDRLRCLVLQSISVSGVRGVTTNVSTEHRLEPHESSYPPARVKFSFNGQELVGYEGEPIAAALLANGIWAIRTDEVSGEPRGIYCGIGHCYECRADIDGVAGVRTCLSPLRQGTQVMSAPTWQIGAK